jgi:hypothetical protein
MSNPNSEVRVMNYSRENPPPGAMWYAADFDLFYRWVAGRAECFDNTYPCWSMTATPWERHYFDNRRDFEPIGIADPNAAMLARDGAPLPTPTPAAPYMVQAPRSGDGLLTMWNPDARGVW